MEGGPKTKDLYRSDVEPDWCPGCGDFGILQAIAQALTELEIPPWQVAIFSGIGCSGKMPHFLNCYGIHTLHGRPLPFAIGAKMAKPSLYSIAISGDGDAYGIGIGHLISAGRRNVNVKYIVHNNGVYGLTKGQASPTLRRRAQPKSLKYPNLNDSINPIALSISAGYTFVARTFAYNVKHMKETIKEAIVHNGIALIDVIQPCPTFNTVDTRESYLARIKMLPEYKKDDINEAMKYALDQDTIWIGVYYRVQRDTYEQRYSEILQNYPQSYPSKISTEITDISESLQDFLC